MKTLSYSQQSLWAGQRLQADAPLYNMAMVFDLPGELNVPLFQRAFSQLVSQSDAMRTVFSEEQGVPMQSVSAAIDNRLVVHDFVDRTTADAWFKERAAYKFDLSQQCFDSCLVRLGDGGFLWYLNQHHLITDAWSKTVQYRTVMTNYARLTAGSTDREAVALTPFETFLAYEREQRLLAAEVEAPELSDLSALDFKHVDTRRQATAAQRMSRPLSVADQAALDLLVQSAPFRSWTKDLSVFLVFATVWSSLLYRLSGQKRFGLQLPAHNRVTPEFKHIPGLFIEMFPLRVEVEENDTFVSLYERLRAATFEWLRYAKTGHGAIGAQGEANVVMNFINARCEGPDGQPPAGVDWLHSGHMDAHHLLRLQVTDFLDSGLPLVSIDASEAHFSAGQQTATLDTFFILLGQLLNKPESKIADAQLVADLEGLVLKGKLNPVDLSQENLLHRYQEIVKTSTEKVAIVYAEDHWTYRQFEENSNRLANYLLRQGIGPESRVAILLPRSPDYLVSVFAILKTGAAFVPVPTNAPSGRVAAILHDAQVALTISREELTSGLPQEVKPVVLLDREAAFIRSASSDLATVYVAAAEETAYVLYTSGSTGLPKGVVISHGALANYLTYALDTYSNGQPVHAPLCTSVGFDLTITSTFLPFVSGGKSVVFPEPAEGADLAVGDALRSAEINFIKLTPAHLGLLPAQNGRHEQLRTMVIGGDNLRTDTASRAADYLPNEAKIFNEYGPTEATVGCIVHQFDAERDAAASSVPIGRVTDNLKAVVVDQHGLPLPRGFFGELLIGGPSLAKGYLFQEELTAEKFGSFLGEKHGRWYQTGDIVRWDDTHNRFEYAGRNDVQLKIGGRRVEPAEIESVGNAYPGINEMVVTLSSRRRTQLLSPEEVSNCRRCGLPENYPQAELDEQQICSFCRSYDNYRSRVAQYFRTPDDLKALIATGNERPEREYDCLALLSGGKDSTYALAKVQEMGFKVLAFTLDNGYISPEAIENVKRVVSQLGVDHVFGRTEAMNDIFVDSLQRHCNVCDGCFKTIYTLSTQIALEKNIPFIVTGLSRGQFFETRLTEELFTSERIDVAEIDRIILNARKAYHQVDDAVRQLLDTSAFDDESTFEKVRYVDFYRYTDVSLEEMIEFLEGKINWKRPSDTGRSTNCLINQAGIFVHKQEQGYSNYAYPYSWDVRLGHKTRDESLEEINEELDVPVVNQILDEIGYLDARLREEENARLLTAYYVADEEMDEDALRAHFRSQLPAYMVPSHFIRIPAVPLNRNGKLDQSALPLPANVRTLTENNYVAPRNDFEQMVHDVWSEVLRIDRIGVEDEFLAIGGDSLSGIRIISRINEQFELDLPVATIFRHPTITDLAIHLEATIRRLLAEMEEDA